MKIRTLIKNAIRWTAVMTLIWYPGNAAWNLATSSNPQGPSGTQPDGEVFGQDESVWDTLFADFGS